MSLECLYLLIDKTTADNDDDDVIIATLPTDGQTDVMLVAQACR